MHLDVTLLRDFYYRSPLGRSAQAVLRRQLLEIWPETEKLSVLGFGFAVPLLRPYLEQSRRVIAVMPAPQGVMPWPAGLPNVTVLADELAWPVETGHVDRMILLHALETSDHPTALLDEVWRVLGPGGRVLIIVPNRAGLWSRTDRTPFGFGRPYSAAQLDALLIRAGFRIMRHQGALWRPPSSRRFWRKTGPAWERVGESLHAVLASGVLIVEAMKQLPRPTGATAARETRILPALEGLAAGPKPVGYQGNK